MGSYRDSSVEAVDYDLNPVYDDTPKDSPLRSLTPPSLPSAADRSLPIRVINGITLMDWRHIRDMAQPECYYSHQLPTLLNDHINAMSETTRNWDGMREAFEGVIRANTAREEPDAPPITLENYVDAAATPPWEFHYSNRMWLGDDIPPPSIEGLGSCDCFGACDPKSKTCACVKRQEKWSKEYTPDFAYTANGRLKVPLIPIFECNDLCRCGPECRNRVSGLAS